MLCFNFITINEPSVWDESDTRLGLSFSQPTCRGSGNTKSYGLTQKKGTKISIDINHILCQEKYEWESEGTFLKRAATTMRGVGFGGSARHLTPSWESWRCVSFENGKQMALTTNPCPLLPCTLAKRKRNASNQSTLTSHCPLGGWALSLWVFKDYFLHGEEINPFILQLSKILVVKSLGSFVYLILFTICLLNFI